MRITDQKYLAAYEARLGFDLLDFFESIGFSDKKADLDFRIRASAVFSSNIEGNTIDLNSYMNSIISKTPFKPQKDLQEIEDLVAAYEFAKKQDLTETKFLQVHKTLSKGLLVKGKRGIYRNDRMGVFDNTGLIYLAVEPELVKENMELFFEDISSLLGQELGLTELFYHAALIHLKFVHIHPFWDGNGRAARLLEKWFLSKKIGERAWKIQAERYYKEHLSDYYAAINLGVNYYELNYDKCMPFLMLLVEALKQEKR
ncbi:MAG: Fic family protein [Bacteroidota bacterium]